MTGNRKEESSYQKQRTLEDVNKILGFGTERKLPFRTSLRLEIRGLNYEPGKKEGKTFFPPTGEMTGISETATKVLEIRVQNQR